MRSIYDKDFKRPVKKQFGFYLICFYIVVFGVSLVQQVLLHYKINFGFQYSVYGLFLHLWELYAEQCRASIGYLNSNQLSRLASLHKDLYGEETQWIYYVMTAALAVTVIVNIIILAVPKLTTNSRYYVVVFVMYFLSWALFSLPIVFWSISMSNYSYDIERIKAFKGFMISRHEFNTLIPISMILTLFGSSFLALVTSCVYTTNTDNSCCYSCLKCLKPYRSDDY